MLGLLGLFKYYNFFLENIAELLSLFGIKPNLPLLKLLMPVGISFYTFQSIGYVVDVKRGRIDAERNLLTLAAYLMFFPQLLSGPISRAVEHLPQWRQSRKFRYETAADGCRQILWGLFKKVAVADQLTSLINSVWADYTHYSSLALFTIAVLYSIQIYADFSGYSDIAIGTAKLFGIRLPINFSYPYLSRNIAEFWKRWHISLQRWFIDYIYIPLGGSRCRRSRVALNTMVVFLVSGLWHGAAWNFISWGLFHALLFLPLLYLPIQRKLSNAVAYETPLPTLKEAAQILLTFVLVTVGWIMFRADNMDMALGYLERMFFDGSFVPVTLPPKFEKTILCMGIMLVAEWLQRRSGHGLSFRLASGTLRPTVVRWSVYWFLAFMILSAPGSDTSFIYFNF